MNNKLISLLAALVVVLAGLYWVFGLPRVADVEIPTDTASIARGEYLFNAGGCKSCHQSEGEDGLTGGYEIEAASPLGGTLTFYSPNITTDVETGIGDWNGRDFILALKHGRSPSGGFYWPAFPFRSYQGMSDAEVLDMAAYIMSLPAIASEVPEHEMPVWQFDWFMGGWNIMADFLEGEPPAISDDPQIQRGAYLARTYSHCGECHTPRNMLGMVDLAHEFEGSEEVTADTSLRAVGNWSQSDFSYFLESGMTASYDFVGSEMMHVIDHTKLLTVEDRNALAAFFTRDVEEE